MCGDVDIYDDDELDRGAEIRANIFIDTVLNPINIIAVGFLAYTAIELFLEHYAPDISIPNNMEGKLWQFHKPAGFTSPEL